MDNKMRGIGLMIFAVLYFIFTVFVIGHRMHFTNSAITVGLLFAGVYFYVKK